MEKRKSYMELNVPYFYTATLFHWNRLLMAEDFKEIVVDSLAYLHKKGKIKVYGFVIMPNHVHLLWEMVEMNGKEMPSASFLKFTAHRFEEKLRREDESRLLDFEVVKLDRKFQFWQTDSLAIRLFDRDICEQKLHYTHQNPLQAHWQLAEGASYYKCSSARFYETGIDDFGFLTHYLDRF